MEYAFCIGWVVFIALIVLYQVYEGEKAKKKSNQDSWRNSQSQNSQQNRQQISSPPPPLPPAARPNAIPPNKNAYHPTSVPGTRPSIRFVDVSDHPIPQNMPKMEDLHDAFTGAPLNANLGLYQCSNCKVYYHADSYAVLKEINNSKCVSCQSTFIAAVTKAAPSKFGRDYKPSVVTLQNYRSYVGQVVTFEGFVYQVAESRRGNDFAVLFENKGWVGSFKLVFFRDSISAMGGRYFINTLGRKKIRVRGLIVNDPTFGYEIIVSEKGMILEISS